MKSLLERAIEYANLLADGSEIIDDTDGQVVRAFRHLLAPLLFKRGLFLRPTERGQVVTTKRPWFGGDAGAPDRLECRGCSQPWFDCACVSMLILGSPELPLLPSWRSIVAGGSA